MIIQEDTNRCVVCGTEIPEGGTVCAGCVDKAAKLLRHRAEEVADELDYCRGNVTYEGCLKCRRMKRNPKHEDCFDELLRDAANLLRAAASEVGHD